MDRLSPASGIAGSGGRESGPSLPAIVGMSIALHIALLITFQSAVRDTRLPPPAEIVAVERVVEPKPEQKRGCGPACDCTPKQAAPVKQAKPVAPAMPPTSGPYAVSAAPAAPLQSAPAQSGQTPASAVCAPAFPVTQISRDQTVSGLGVPVAHITQAAPRTASPAAPAAASAPRPDTARARESYKDVLRGLIDRYKEYPAFARRARKEGVCVLRCVVERSGEIKSVSVLSSSGNGMLDGAAERAVKNVGKFPPVPGEIGGQEVLFEVAVAFRLTGNY